MNIYKPLHLKQFSEINWQVRSSLKTKHLEKNKTKYRVNHAFRNVASIMWAESVTANYFPRIWYFVFCGGNVLRNCDKRMCVLQKHSLACGEIQKTASKAPKSRSNKSLHEALASICIVRLYLLTVFITDGFWSAVHFLYWTRTQHSFLILD